MIFKIFVSILSSLYSLCAFSGGLSHQTFVLMADGSEQDIAQLVTNAQVSGRSGSEVGTVVNQSIEMAYTISLTTVSTALSVTHSQLLMTKSGWVRALDLREGDEILCLDGYEVIESFHYDEKIKPVYIVTTFPEHHFYANGIFVHNGWSKWDPFNKNSDVRKAARSLDVTNPNSAIRKVGRAVDPMNSHSNLSQVAKELDDVEKGAVGIAMAGLSVGAFFAAGPVAAAVGASTEVTVGGSVAGASAVVAVNGGAQNHNADEKRDSKPAAKQAAKSVVQNDKKSDVNWSRETAKVISDAPRRIDLSNQQLSPRSHAARCGFDYTKQGVEDAEDGTAFFNPVSVPKTAVGKVSRVAYNAARGYGRAAANRALHEKQKVELRKDMQKPYVEDSKLNKTLKKLYREDAEVGSGSTAAAVRNEIATGQPTKGSFHTQKAQDYVKPLKDWLRDNPRASAGDRAAAENVLKDMQQALEGIK